MVGHDLLDTINISGGRLSEDRARRYFFQLLEGAPPRTPRLLRRLRCPHTTTSALLPAAAAPAARTISKSVPSRCRRDVLHPQQRLLPPRPEARELHDRDRHRHAQDHRLRSARPSVLSMPRPSCRRPLTLPFRSLWTRSPAPHSDCERPSLSSPRPAVPDGGSQDPPQMAPAACAAVARRLMQRPLRGPAPSRPPLLRRRAEQAPRERADPDDRDAGLHGAGAAGAPRREGAVRRRGGGHLGAGRHRLSHGGLPWWPPTPSFDSTQFRPVRL